MKTKQDILEEQKTKEQILEQVYMSTKDLKQITGFGLARCQEEMKKLMELAIKQDYYIPEQRAFIVPTKVVKKKFKL